MDKQTNKGLNKETLRNHKDDNKKTHTEGCTEVGERDKLILLEVGAEALILGQRDDCGASTQSMSSCPSVSTCPSSLDAWTVLDRCFLTMLLTVDLLIPILSAMFLYENPCLCRLSTLSSCWVSSFSVLCLRWSASVANSLNSKPRKSPIFSIS